MIAREGATKTAAAAQDVSQPSSLSVTLPEMEANAPRGEFRLSQALFGY
jgi:hypothetical protein